MRKRISLLLVLTMMFVLVVQLPAGASEPILKSISANPGSMNLLPGESQQVEVTAKFSDGTTKLITGNEKSSISYAVSFVGSIPAEISKDGVVTSVFPGKATLGISYKGKYVPVKITVKDPKEPPLMADASGRIVEELTVRPGKLYVDVGNAGMVGVYVEYTNGQREQLEQYKLKYTVEDTDIAKALNWYGQILAKKEGSTIVTVSYCGRTAKFPLYVKDVPAVVPSDIIQKPMTEPLWVTHSPNPTSESIVSIASTPGKVNIKAGKTKQLKVTVKPVKGKKQTVTSLAQYNAGDKTIAKVSQGGLVTGIKPGVTNIAITYEGKTIRVPVTIK